MKKKEIIRKSTLFVKKQLQQAEGGHDWLHIERVMNTAEKILKKEKADKLVVMLGLLFHDVADPKFHSGDKMKGPKITSAFLKELELAPDTINRVVDITSNISYNGGFDKKEKLSRELMVARDADRLDAIGAVGIARAFNYGGYAGRKMYDPAIKPEKYSSEQEYRNNKAPTLNHFYEKLLNLKDGMYTKTGKKIARKRHDYMEDFISRFKKEIKGKA